MSDDQSYELLLPKWMELHADEVRNPDMPVNEAVNEGEKTALLFKEDIALFERIGLSPQLGEECAAAAGALRVSDGKWLASWGEKKESQKLWEEKEKPGYELRDGTLSALSYALRNNSRAVRIVRKIRQGGSDRDMIHDLRAEKELGEKYQKELEAILFDLAILDQCGAMADELGSLYAMAYVDDSSSEALDIRNRAYTYMRMVAGEILEAAEYVLRNNPDRLKQYYSEYRRKQYRSRGEKEVEPAVETPALN